MTSFPPPIPPKERATISSFTGGRVDVAALFRKVVEVRSVIGYQRFAFDSSVQLRLRELLEAEFGTLGWVFDGALETIAAEGIGAGVRLWGEETLDALLERGLLQEQSSPETQKLELAPSALLWARAGQFRRAFNTAPPIDSGTTVAPIDSDDSRDVSFREEFSTALTTGDFARLFDHLWYRSAKSSTANNSLAWIAALHATEGRIDDAVATFSLVSLFDSASEVDSDSDSIGGFGLDRAAAWFHAALGNTTESIRHLRRELDRLRALQRSTAAAEEAARAELCLLSDLARFGEHREALSRLPWRATGRHALVVRSLGSQSQVELSAAASDLDAIGCRFLAGELWLAVRIGSFDSLLSTREQRGQEAGRYRTSLATSSRLHRVGGQSLTSRELQVGRLAAGGSTSRTIAADLGVSIRTVDNLLGRVYVKLGVVGRLELVDHLAHATAS